MHSRSLKIAGVAALAGMMMAVILAGLDRKPPVAPEIATVPASKRADLLTHELNRCATLTMPDAGCEAAWAANRRRFFGQDDRGHDEAAIDRTGLTDVSAATGQNLPERAASPATEGAQP